MYLNLYLYLFMSWYLEIQSYFYDFKNTNRTAQENLSDTVMKKGGAKDSQQ